MEQVKMNEKNMNSKAPLVSVIVPAYNVAGYIGQTIDSIFHQIYCNIEIIIVDDCSTDGTSEICEEVKNNNKKIKYMRHNTNQGQTLTRNDGLKMASGDWLMFLDGDDVLEPHAITTMVNSVTDNEIDIVFAGYESIDCGEVTEHLATIEEGIYPRNGFVNFIFDEMSASVLTCIGSKLYRTSFIKERKPYTSDTIKTNYDMAFVIDALIACRKIAYVNRPVYGYIQRDNSITHSYRNNMFRFICDARKKIPDLFEECNCDKQKSILFQRKQLALINSALKQEVMFDKGYNSFKECVNNISSSKEFEKLAAILSKDKIGIAKKVYIDLVRKKKVMILYAFYKIQKIEFIIKRKKGGKNV